MFSPKWVTVVTAVSLMLCLTGCIGLSTAGNTTNQTSSDFGVSVNPGSATLAVGGTTTVNAAVSATGGFSGTVQLTVTGQPAGVSATLSSAAVSGAGDPTLTFSANDAALPGTYTLTLWGASGTVTHSATINLQVSNSTLNPSFSLAVTPASLSVAAGSNTSFAVSVAALNGFTGTVTFSASGMPDGMQATFSPASVTTSGTSTLNISTASATTEGTYVLTVAGLSGPLLQAASVTVTVTPQAPPPDFSIIASPGSQDIAAGTNTSFTVSVGALNGFTGTVSLSASGLPSGMQGTFSPASISTSGNSTLSITTTTSTAPGNYTLTVSGVSGSLNHSTTVTVLVGANAPPPDFSISASPSTQTIVAGTNGSVTVTVGALNGFTGAVSLTASGLPAGMSGTFNPASVNTSGTSILSIATTATTIPGTYTLTIAGANGSLSHTTSVSVTVADQANFSIAAAPGSQTLTAGTNTSFVVTVEGVNGFTSSVAMTESGMPAGMAASCSPSTISGSGNCTLNVSTTSTTAAGTYTLTITGTSGTLTHSTSVSVKVNAVTQNADFTLTASPASQPVTVGNSAKFTATVAAQNGFTGAVALAATGMPSGVTAKFSPTSITTSGNATLTVSAAIWAASGNYTLTVTGTSGSLSHTTNISITVAPQLNVLQYPGLTSTQWFTNDFPTYIFNNPVVNGVTIGIEWAGSDQGPSAGSSQYDWSYPDSQMQAWVQAGKKVNIVVSANADSGSDTCGPESQYGTDNIGNCAIPTYVWSALGSSNITSCLTQYGTQQMPNYFASAFQSNYQAFMAAIIKHYTGNPSIGYIRFGMGHGGESLPVANWNDTTTACGQAFVNSWGMTIQTWENYLQTMLNYEGSLKSPIQLMDGITPMGAPNTEVPDFAAPIAVHNGIGFGSQGLELTDVNNCAGATADWCELFAQYTGQVPLELQTYLQSCPDNSCTTGSLVDLVPFAVANHATVFEFYWQDWLVAYDPNFPGYYPQYQPVLAAAAVGQ
jgi:uncharacterized membrane protein